MGFVGLIIWVLILATGFGTLFMRAWNGRIENAPYAPERREEIVFWILMLVSTYVNSSFGVLMEGPVFGVMFWFGLGFAIARSQRAGAAATAAAALAARLTEKPRQHATYPRWRKRPAVQSILNGGF
jgi:hypothetical protein